MQARVRVRDLIMRARVAFEIFNIAMRVLERICDGDPQSYRSTI